MITPESPLTAAEVLKKRKAEIIDRWKSLLKKEVPKAQKLAEPILIDTIPVFIVNLSEALNEGDPRLLATDASNFASEHGGERARLTSYSPEDLLREIQILRDTIFDMLIGEVNLSEKDRRIIQGSFNQTIQQSMMGFFLVLSRLREQFVASLSHDLRNPLGTVRMAAELILNAATGISESDVRQDVESLAQRIVKNSKRADRLIQNLLDTSALHMGERPSLNLVESDLFGIINDVISDLDRHQQPRIRLRGTPVRGFWDPEALRRAIENLVTNAFKYGSPETPVGILVNVEAGRVILCVHNEGSYIPIEEQESLFQAFRRSAAAKQSGKRGWGIGLALVRGVAEAHGGSIGVDSSQQKGTTFMIDFPIDSREFQKAPITEV